MITTAGKTHIKRYLAGYEPDLASSMVFGIGETAENLSDVFLKLQVIDTPINLSSYDFVNNKLVYKATVPEEYSGKIYEIGLYNLIESPFSGDYESRLIATFDSNTEDWLDASDNDAPFTSATSRTGTDSLNATPAASTTVEYSFGELELDLSGYSGNDVFKFAYNVGNSNTSNITFRFVTDNSNYFDIAIASPTSGFKFSDVLKGNATSTGTPDWANITEIRVRVTSGSGGASNVEFDAIRIESQEVVNSNYVLVARKVLGSPITKIVGQSQEVEFTLDVSI